MIWYLHIRLPAELLWYCHPRVNHSRSFWWYDGIVSNDANEQNPNEFESPVLRPKISIRKHQKLKNTHSFLISSKNIPRHQLSSSPNKSTSNNNDNDEYESEWVPSIQQHTCKWLSYIEPVSSK